MRFRLIDAAKKEFPVQRLCKVLASARAAILPGMIDRPAIDSMRTWCC
jgi:putative transposase